MTYVIFGELQHFSLPVECRVVALLRHDLSEKASGSRVGLGRGCGFDALLRRCIAT